MPKHNVYTHLNTLYWKPPFLRRFMTIDARQMTWLNKLKKSTLCLVFCFNKKKKKDFDGNNKNKFLANMIL